LTWVRIDDHFADHPKLLKAGPIAGWLHLAGLCYSARHLTDGQIPVQAIHTLAVFNGVAVTGDGQLFTEPMRVDVFELAGILVRAGLWEELRDGATKVIAGWRIHDYLAYNPSRSSILGRRGGKRTGGLARSADARRNKDGRFAPADQQPAGDVLVQLHQPRTPTRTPSPIGTPSPNGDVRRGRTAR
jgi:hypothetical protein